MFHFRVLLLGFFLVCLSLSAFAADPPAQDSASYGHTIAVADFSGYDPEVGRFIAETLLTDLAQSRLLHFAERSEIRRALDELKLQSTGLIDPQQITQLGKLVSADRLVVGSYLEAEDQIIINARLLDIGTGRLSEGGAGNVSGDRRNLLSLVHRLAHQFHRRVTGEDFVIDGEGAEASSHPYSAAGSIRPSNSGFDIRPSSVPGQPASPGIAPQNYSPAYPNNNGSNYRVGEGFSLNTSPRIIVPPLVTTQTRAYSPPKISWTPPPRRTPNRYRPVRIPLEIRPVNRPLGGSSVRWRIL